MFDSEFKTFNGMPFKEGMKAHVDGEIKAGPDGNGFHLCLNFEDTFRFGSDNPILCEVIGFGTISPEYMDGDNDYYDIYACSDIYIKRVISRAEIVEMASKLPYYRLERLIQTYTMSDLEIENVLSNVKKF